MALTPKTGSKSDDLPEHDPRVEKAIERAQAEIDKYEKHEEVSRESAVRAFQIRVRAAMNERGWTQSDLSRACERIKGGPFGRDVISTYMKTDRPSMPRPNNLAIIARALGVDQETLFPSRERLRMGLDRRSPSAEVRDAGEGLAWLKINQAVEWSVALEVMRILKENNDSETSNDK